MEENIQNEKKQLLKPKNDVVFQWLFNQKNEKITWNKSNKRNKRIWNKVEDTRDEKSAISIDRRSGIHYTRITKGKERIWKKQRQCKGTMDDVLGWPK